MKKSSVLRKAAALILAAVMLTLTACSGNTVPEESTVPEETPETVYSFSETSENVTKSETVYVNLDNNGQPRQITVSDWLHADRGNIYVNDKTTLKDFSVTKGQASVVSSDGSVIWQMATSDVYYEGKSDKELPVDIGIKYFLDDNEITPEELAGKSGRFRMEVTMENKVAKEVEVNGEKVTMYAPVAVLGGMILSYENFSDIEVTNGLAIGGGSYEVVVLAGAPGLNESLRLDKLNISGFEDFSFPSTFTVSATVTDFAFSDTYYAVVPLSSLDLNIDLPKTLEDVQSILTELGNFEELLGVIDPNNVLTDFLTDGTSLAEMMNVMQEAVEVYRSNEALLKVMSQYLTPENISTLSSFLETLDTEQMQSLISIMSNVPALQTLVDSLLQLSTGVGEVMPILQGFSDALEDPEVAAALENLPETLSTLDQLMDYLNENEDVLNVLTQLMTSDDMAGFTEILDNMIQSSGADLSGTDVSQLTGDAKEIVARMDEWLKFDYSIYTDAADYMETSCMFIYKTDPIAAKVEG